jgi:hypothetical protein
VAGAYKLSVFICFDAAPQVCAIGRQNNRLFFLINYDAVVKKQDGKIIIQADTNDFYGLAFLFRADHHTPQAEKSSAQQRSGGF